MLDLVQRIMAVGHSSHMQPLHLHFYRRICLSIGVDAPRTHIPLAILRERAGLVAEQIFYPPKLFRQGARSDNRIGNLGIVHDLMRIDGLSHIQIDSQTADCMNVLCLWLMVRDSPDRDNRGEQDQEPEEINIPGTSEPIQRNEDKRERKRYRTQNLFTVFRA